MYHEQEGQEVEVVESDIGLNDKRELEVVLNKVSQALEGVLVGCCLEVDSQRSVEKRSVGEQAPR